MATPWGSSWGLLGWSQGMTSRVVNDSAGPASMGPVRPAVVLGCVTVQLPHASQ